MISFDLRWFLFGTFVLFLATAVIAYAIGKWTAQRNRLQQTIEWLTPALDSALAGVIIFSLRNRLLYGNASARTLLGMRSDDWNLPDVIWDRLGEIVQRTDEANGETLALPWHRLDVTMPAADGEFPLTLWITSVPGGTVGIVQDRSATLAGVRESQLLLGGLSHELRTPLATMATHVELLRTPSLPVEVRNQSLRLLGEETGRLARLVSNAVELGRIESGIEFNLQPVDVIRVAEEAAMQMSSLAQAAGTTITLSAQRPLPFVLGQPDRLKQVFLNLLDNAIKYGLSDIPIEVAIKATKLGIWCAVIDQGAGIATVQIPLLTQRFYRAAAENIPGNGLGLSIVEAILRQHGSRLQIASARTADLAVDNSAGGKGNEQGTVVSFMLPWAGVAVRHE